MPEAVKEDGSSFTRPSETAFQSVSDSLDALPSEVREGLAEDCWEVLNDDSLPHPELRAGLI